MRQTTSPMQALYRVFVLPTLQQTATCPLATTRRLYSSTSSTSTKTTKRPTILTKKFQLHSVSSSSISSPFSTSAHLSATRPPEKRTQPWDEEIPAKRIQIVDPETKSLQPPTLLSHALSSLDRKTHRLVCVTAVPSGRRHPNLNQRTTNNNRNSSSPRAADEWAASEAEEWIPTVRLVSKKDQYEAEKARRSRTIAAKKNSGDVSGKTLELNWAIDPNDLGHRTKRLREFLAEGRKVEVVLAKRKGGRRASLEECEGLISRIGEAVKEVRGAKEGKKAEGKVGGVVTLFFEGVKRDGGAGAGASAKKGVE